MVFMLIDHINTIKCPKPCCDMVCGSTCIMRDEGGHEDMIELSEKLWRYSGDCHLLGVKVWI